MATTFPPSTVQELYEIVEGGQVYSFIEVTFPNPVLLSGLPGYHVTDGAGKVHRVSSASPHITDPALYASYVHLRTALAVTVPPLTHLTVPNSDPHISNAGGDLVTAGTYGVVAPIPPPPP